MDQATASRIGQAGTAAPHAENTLAWHPPSKNISKLSVADGAFAELDPSAVRLARLLSDARLPLWLKKNLELVEWQVLPRHALASQRLGWIDFQAANAYASIGIVLARQPALASVLGDTSASPEEFAATASLRNAVLAILLKPVLDAFAALGIPDVHAAVRGAGGRSGPVCTLRCATATHRFEVALGAIDDSWLELIERKVAAQAIDVSRRLGEIAIPGRLCLGQQSLSVAQLNSLRPGDIVLGALPAALRDLLEPSNPAVAMEARWGAPATHQLQARVNVESNRLTFMENPLMTYETLENETSVSDADTPVAIGELDLPVKFEIDTVSLSVAQLSALQAGYVLELPTRVSETRIRLVAYGQTIGQGELVSIGEQMGVRIVKMSHDHGPV